MIHFHSVPKTGDGIVILTNSQRSWPLFGYIFRYWAQWCGFGSIGMGKIITAQNILWIFIGATLFFLILYALQLLKGIITGTIIFAPLSKEHLLLRIIQIFISLSISLVLLWSINQDYLILTSVFPIATQFFGITAFLFSMLLLLSALFPSLKDTIKHTN